MPKQENLCRKGESVRLTLAQGEFVHKAHYKSQAPRSTVLRAGIQLLMLIYEKLDDSGRIDLISELGNAKTPAPELSADMKKIVARSRPLVRPQDDESSLVKRRITG